MKLRRNGYIMLNRVDDLINLFFIKAMSCAYIVKTRNKLTFPGLCFRILSLVFVLSNPLQQSQRKSFVSIKYLQILQYL